MKIWNRNCDVLEGFSLIEMAMVLLVIGIIAGSVFKGKDVIESAQIRSVANDIECIIMACNSYSGTYDCLPGDDKNANSKFSGVDNGDGDGKYSMEDASKVFSHLHAAGLISSSNFKTPKIGGMYSMVAESNKLKLKISSDNEGIMTHKQVMLLKAKLMEMIGEEGVKIETVPELSQKGEKYVVKILIQ